MKTRDKVSLLLICIICFSSSFHSFVYGQSPYQLQPEVHQRIVEEGYSEDQIIYMIVLVIIAIIIPAIFLHPKMRKKFNSYGN